MGSFSFLPSHLWAQTSFTPLSGFLIFRRFSTLCSDHLPPKASWAFSCLLFSLINFLFFQHIFFSESTFCTWQALEDAEKKKHHPFPLGAHSLMVMTKCYQTVGNIWDTGTLAWTVRAQQLGRQWVATSQGNKGHLDSVSPYVILHFLLINWGHWCLSLHVAARTGVNTVKAPGTYCWDHMLTS